MENSEKGDQVVPDESRTSHVAGNAALASRYGWLKHIRSEWGTRKEQVGNHWAVQKKRRRRKHLYSASEVARVGVVHVLALLAALIATAVAIWRIKTNAWLGGVAAVGISTFGLLLFSWLFESVLWHLKPTECLPRATMIDLTGIWKGYLVVKKGIEGEENPGDKLDCEVLVKQDWSRIAIRLTTNETFSWSQMASLDGRKLHYEYCVEQRPGLPEDRRVLKHLQPHYGLARMDYLPPEALSPTSRLKGQWFNDEKYQRWGEVCLERVGMEAGDLDDPGPYVWTGQEC